MPGEHSSIVGGSNAGRLLNCPGSYAATMALPPSANVETEYAAEGTAMHEVMTRLMRTRQVGIDNAKSLILLARSWIGQETFYDRKLTSEHVDTMIEPAIDWLTALERDHGGGFAVVGVEMKVKFPGIPGAFGTCDLILQNRMTVLHVDWKFGQGVGVKALYRDEGGEYVNPQLMFYITGAMHTSKSIYAGRRKLVGAIIQPRTEEPLTSTFISRKEIKWFAEDLEEAVLTALDRDPPKKKGEWCRFAACKLNCEHWTGPLLDLSALGVAKQGTGDAAARKVTPFGAYLSKAKQLCDMAVMLKKEVDEQLHHFLDEGGLVPGWRLKAKAKNRAWIEPEIVEPALLELGFTQPEIWQRKLQTFASVDATAKRLDVEIPSELRVAPLTNETTICPTDDPAPVVERKLAIEQFSEALKALQEGK